MLQQDLERLNKNILSFKFPDSTSNKNQNLILVFIVTFLISVGVMYVINKKMKKTTLFGSSLLITIIATLSMYYFE